MHITVQIHVGACWKDSTFPNYDFRKGQCTFYPIKVYPFAGKKVRQKYQNFLPLQTGSNASWPTKLFKSQTFFLRVLGIQTSWILWIWQIIPQKVTSKKNWKPNPTQLPEWDKVWSRLSSHLQPFFSAHNAYFNNFRQKIPYLTRRDKRESYLIVLQKKMFRYAKDVRLASFLALTCSLRLTLALSGS